MKLPCRQCGLLDEPEIIENRFHKGGGAYCKGCRSWIKWMLVKVDNDELSIAIEKIESSSLQSSWLAPYSKTLLRAYKALQQEITHG